MIHVIYDRHAKAIAVHDLHVLREVYHATGECDAPAGHFKVTRLSSTGGRARIHFDNLTDRDIESLIKSEKATIVDDRLRLNGLSAAVCVEELRRTLGAPLLHNADVSALAAYLEPQLRIGRLVALSVVGGC